MKRLFIFIFISATVTGFAMAESEEMVLVSIAGIDSSVGKNPNFTSSFFPSDLISGAAFSGKLPVAPSFDGPPPRKNGPGLRFNTKKWFYIYTDRGAAPNHFAPSGWMGDYDDLHLDIDSKDDPADGKTCIKISYDATGSQGAGWAGMYWQQPVNNWGNKEGGFNLKGMKQLTFWGRGAAGGEQIAEFKVGGIGGEHPDSGQTRIGPVILTSEWRQYVIDLSGVDLSHISGGFAWSASQDDNPHGMTFYLDEIRFER